MSISRILFVVLVISFKLLILATTILCVVAGLPKVGLEDYHILSVDATCLKATNGGLQIHNYYKLYLTTQCASNYDKHSNSRFVVTCSKPSSNEKFFLSNLISRGLHNSADGSNFTNNNIANLVRKELDEDFKRHNLGFHVAYGFYISGAIFAFLTYCALHLFFLDVDEILLYVACLFLLTLISLLIPPCIINGVARNVKGSIERYDDINFLSANTAGKYSDLSWAPFAVAISLVGGAFYA